MEKRRYSRQGKRVDIFESSVNSISDLECLEGNRTFSVITETHFSLAKTNCVFPLADSIEFFEFCLVDAL